jgi:FAD/FMN-containing dehydrogenase
MKRTTHIAGWGNYPRAEVVEYSPSRLSECPDDGDTAYLARGLGRSYGDAGLPAAGVESLNTQFLKQLISFDPETGILEAEAGISLADILRYFVPKGFFLPVTPGTKFVTLGGAVASNVHGKNHHHKGSIENFVKKLRVRTPTGTFECSPTVRPDLFRGTVSGYGLTGLIETVTLQMRPIETSYFRTLNVPARNLDELFALFEQHDQTYEFSAAWIDTLAKGRSMGRAVLFLGEHAKRDELSSKQARDPYKLPNNLDLNVPIMAPSGLLNPFTLKFFNQGVYSIKKQGTTERIEDYDTFFYPLDWFHNWNRAYGRRGFLQYQYIIPDPHGVEGTRACLEFLSRHKIGSFLSVLKRYGDDHPIIPFAKSGYGLAMDLPFRHDTLPLLEELDKIVIRYGGRVYLSKDARLSGSTFREMYPTEHIEWREVIATYNPNRTVWSAMAERLEL